MAKPRVFVSSTYYDLKRLRPSLDVFIESLGFEPLLSEKGNIGGSPGAPLDESCYREAATADIFVLIIGGRYRPEASAKRDRPTPTYIERYQNITKKEYEQAIARDIPVYLLVETNVYAEFQTYLRNRDNPDVVYAHVDSVDVFRLIEEIFSKLRNHPIHTFERFGEIKTWLREQWASYFRELLHRQSQQQQLAALHTRVAELKGLNEMLRKYVEALTSGMAQPNASCIIEVDKPPYVRNRTQ